MKKIPVFADCYEPSYLLEVRLGKAMHMMALMPILDEISSDGTYTYCLFESAATKYSTMPFNRCLYPLDCVVPLRTAELVGRS